MKRACVRACVGGWVCPRARCACGHQVLAVGAAGPQPPPSVSCTNFLLQTPLHVAARAGHTPTVRALLLARAHVDAQDAQGLTPLATAAMQGTAPAGEGWGGQGWRRGQSMHAPCV